MGIAGAAEGQRSGGQATNDAMKKQVHARSLGGARHEDALVDPKSRPANVALEEDGYAFIGNAVHRRQRGAFEPVDPGGEAKVGQLGKIG